MIFDAENTFFWNKALKTTTEATSDVVKTGYGDAVNPLLLFVSCQDASGALTVTLETAETADFKTAVTLATYTAPQTGTIKAKLPYGDLGYLRLKYAAEAALTAGSLSASLVMDTDLA